MTNYDYLVKELNLSEPQLEAVVKLASICGMQTIMEGFNFKTKIKDTSAMPKTDAEVRMANAAKELAEKKEADRKKRLAAEEARREREAEKEKEYWDKINARDEVAPLSSVFLDESDPIQRRKANAGLLATNTLDDTQDDLGRFGSDTDEFNIDSMPTLQGDLDDFYKTDEDLDDDTEDDVSKEQKNLMELVNEVGQLSPMANVEDLKQLAVNLAGAGDKESNEFAEKLKELIVDANKSIRVNREAMAEPMQPIYLAIKDFRKDFPDNPYGKLFELVDGYPYATKKSTGDSVAELSATKNFSDEPKPMLTSRDYMRTKILTPELMNKIRQRKMTQKV